MIVSAVEQPLGLCISHHLPFLQRSNEVGITTLVYKHGTQAQGIEEE